MKKNKSVIVCNLLIIFTCLTVSCGHNNDSFSHNVIPIASTAGSYHLLNLSEYASDVRYIPLETSESSLIAEIQQIVYEDKKMVISDNNYNCYLFDNNGTLQRRVGSIGRGPGEYQFITYIMVHSHLIFLHDRFKMIVRCPNFECFF